MANAFFVRCDCRNRRFTGGKSRFLQEADGRKGIASAADELCGSAFDVAEGFASAEARRGLSARPLHPFGLHTHVPWILSEVLWLVSLSFSQPTQ